MFLHSRPTASAVLVVAFAALVYCGPSGAERMQDDTVVRSDSYPSRGRPSRAPASEARPLGELLNADRITLAELGEVARAFNASEYWHARWDDLLVEANVEATIMVLGQTETTDDKILATGHLITDHTSIKRGLLLNLGPESVWVTPDDGFGEIEVYARGVFAVGSHVARQEGRDTDPNSCSVTCVEGYWACCECAPDFPCTCKCFPVKDFNEECDSGGEGATQCSTSRPEA